MTLWEQLRSKRRDPLFQLKAALGRAGIGCFLLALFIPLWPVKVLFVGLAVWEWWDAAKVDDRPWDNPETSSR